jgi:hypothetical protein
MIDASLCRADDLQQLNDLRRRLLKVVAVIVSKCGDLSSADDMRDAAVEQFIEERRQQALKMIAKMDEPDDA